VSLQLLPLKSKSMDELSSHEKVHVS